MNTNPITTNLQTVRNALTDVLAAERQLQKTKDAARERITSGLNAYGEACSAANMKHDDVIDMGDGQILTIKEEWYEFMDPLDAVKLDSKPVSLDQLSEEFERARDAGRP